MKELLKKMMKETSFEIFIENHPAIIWIVDTKTGEIVATNKAATDFYGYSKEEFSKLVVSQINTYSEMDLFDEMQMAKKQKRNYFKFTHRLKDGTVKKVIVESFPLKALDKDLLFSVIKEDTDKHVENKAFDLNQLIKNSGDAICILNSENIEHANIIYANKSFAQITNIHIQNLNGMMLLDVFDKTGNETYDDFTYSGRPHEFHLKDTSNTTVSINCIRVRKDGEVFTLAHMKLLDYLPISKIMIKESFMKDVENIFKNMIGYYVAVQFYTSNSKNEHTKGYFTFIYQNLIAILNKHAFKYSISSDNYCIVLFISEPLLVVSDLLNAFLNAIGTDYERSLYRNLFKIRIGVIPKDSGETDIFEAFEKSFELFDEGQYNEIIFLKYSEDLDRALVFKRDLSKVLTSNQLMLFGQPIVDLESAKIMGIEILLRWNHPLYGVTSPNEFIHYSEVTGQIIKIDTWVLNKTLELLITKKKQLKNLKIHVNISSKSLENEQLYTILKKYGDYDLLDNLVVEITEESDVNVITETYLKLRQLNVTFAMDDFGTGFSSFDRLRQTGVKFIKIDRSFIATILENPDDMIILSAIISMCISLNIEIIAEGVETIEQIEFLRAKKCNNIQGFYFSKPLEINELFDKLYEIENTIRQLLVKIDHANLVDTMFYNKGQVYIQDLNKEFKFISPNLQLLEKLKCGVEQLEQINILDFMDSNEQKYFLKFVSLLNNPDDVYSFNLSLIPENKVIFKVTCAVKMLNFDLFRLFIEFSNETEEEFGNLVGISRSYTETFYNAPVGMILLNDAFQIVRCNFAAANLLELEEIELKKQNLLRVVSDVKLNHLFNEALSNSVSDGVIEIQTKSTHKKTVQWIIKSIEDQLTCKKTYMCIVQDLTEKIQFENERSKINTALNMSKSLIMMTDLEGNIEYVNETFSIVTGYSLEEIRGKNANFLSSKEVNLDFYKDLTDTLESGNIWNGEFLNKKKDGSSYWCYSNLYPIFENDKITGYLGIQQDITAEKELKNTNESLKNTLIEQDKIASIGMLSSGIMHEINNPLVYMQENINYLIKSFDTISQASADELEDYKEALGDISTGIIKIKGIAEGLKKYLYKNESDLPEPVNLLDLINSVLLVAKNEYKYYASANIVAREDEVYIVEGFSSKLEQVFLNLLINATHAIKASEVDIVGEIEIKLEKIEHTISISFKDNGCGMSEEVKAKIFEPLFTTKEKGVGTGLGLSITKQIIEELHGGVVICVSELGNGTTFKISLRSHG